MDELREFTYLLTTYLDATEPSEAESQWLIASIPKAFDQEYLTDYNRERHYLSRPDSVKTLAKWLLRRLEDDTLTERQINAREQADIETGASFVGQENGKRPFFKKKTGDKATSSNESREKLATPAKPGISGSTKLSEEKCGHCKKNHKLFHCYEFGNMSPEKKMELVLSIMACFICLKVCHKVADCPQKKYQCRYCAQGRKAFVYGPHHAWLHVETLTALAHVAKGGADQNKEDESPSSEDSELLD